MFCSCAPATARARSSLKASCGKKDAGRFRAFSAGSHPKGAVNPFALKVLESLEYPTDDLRSKSWDEFAAPGAPVMDFVFTVCDTAAAETCPVWPGQPMTAHWGIEDPAAVEGTDIQKEAAFVLAARYLKNRISHFREPAPQEPRQDVAEREAARDRRARRRDEAAAGGRVMDVIIYHNPACETSRNVLAMIRNSGVEPHIIEYLKCPPTRLLADPIARSRRPDRAPDLARERHAVSRTRAWRSVALRRCVARRDRRASDPDEPAARRDAERRAPVSSLGNGPRPVAAATRTNSSRRMASG